MYYIAEYDEEKHYKMLSEWWKAYDWEEGVPAKLLPKDGYVVYVDSHPIVAGFMYLSSNSPVAFMGYFISDKNANRTVIQRSLVKLIEQLKSLGKQHVGEDGYIFTLTSHKGLKTAFENSGFVPGETDATTYYYPFTDFNTDFLQNDE